MREAPGGTHLQEGSHSSTSKPSSDMTPIVSRYRGSPLTQGGTFGPALPLAAPLAVGDLPSHERGGIPRAGRGGDISIVWADWCAPGRTGRTDGPHDRRRDARAEGRRAAGEPGLLQGGQKPSGEKKSAEEPPHRRYEGSSRLLASIHSVRDRDDPRLPESALSRHSIAPFPRRPQLSQTGRACRRGAGWVAGTGATAAMTSR